MVDKKQLPDKLKLFFWEYDQTQLDIIRFKDLIIERLLEKGTLPTIKWVFKTFTAENIKGVVFNSLNLSQGTRKLWKSYFNAPV